MGAVGDNRLNQLHINLQTNGALRIHRFLASNHNEYSETKTAVGEVMSQWNLGQNVTIQNLPNQCKKNDPDLCHHITTYSYL